MNRKKVSKIKKIVAADIAALSPLDDPLNWVRGNIPCPWTPEQMADYQRKLDTAFGVERGIVLAWSYDRKYWDELYMDGWDIYGEPTTTPQKTPILLFKQMTLGKDRFYISAPRFMLLEALHGSQMEASWEAERYEADDSFIGGRKRIRRMNPPEFMYQPLLAPLGTLAHHEYSNVIGGMRPCCRRLWEANQSICYGKYRPPTVDDLIAVKKIRERMDADGLYQRNDQGRSKKLISNAAAATKFQIEYAARKQSEGVRQLLMSDPTGYMGDIMKNYGVSAKQIEESLKEGFKRKEEKELV